MNVAAFLLLAFGLTSYVLLDGYDLGVGAVHLLAARTSRERQNSLRTIGPFWQGNEVMLIAVGALLFALFPKVYAASFSGFYLPLVIVLWLFMARGISIELRDHFASELWSGFWDVAFCTSSVLLAVVFGLALGNVIRGVPLNASGYFAGTFGFLLNGYAVAVGLFALAALSMHGAAFVWLRANGVLRERARTIAWITCMVALVLFAIVTVMTLSVHPVPRNGALWIAPAVGLGALVLLAFARRAEFAFAYSSIFLIALMASAAETLFPYLLPRFPIGSGGLDIANSAPVGFSLPTALAAGVIGIGAALVYGTLTARRILLADNGPNDNLKARRGQECRPKRNR